MPGITEARPGSATFPFPGVEADVVDDGGRSVPLGGGGYLVIKRPWPAMARTIWGDPERWRQQYWSRFEGVYFTGDGAKRDEEGYYWLLGRVDDVVNVSGHRIGTMEVESALVSHPAVAEAAVIGVSHEVKGQAIAAFVTLRAGYRGDQELAEELREHVAEKIGGIAKPDRVYFTAELPKTRSAKIVMSESSPPFPVDRMERLQRMEENHFWFRGRRMLVESWLPTYGSEHVRKVVDIGCGTGYNLATLIAKGYQGVGIDLSSHGLRIARSRLPAGTLVQGDGEELPFRSSTFDAVIALDVLEHVDDGRALAEAFRVLRPGGLVVITVPAWAFLYGHRDRAAGHRRRYSRRHLCDLLVNSGFEVIEAQYYMSLLFPFLAVARLLLGFSRRWRDAEDMPPGIINAVLYGIVKVEVKTKRWFRMPWGSTVAAIARRPAL
jgi:SAM-dependent methyltransferase